MTRLDDELNEFIEEVTDEASMVALYLETGKIESFFQMENSMILSRKVPWTRPLKSN